MWVDNKLAVGILLHLCDIVLLALGLLSIIVIRDTEIDLNLFHFFDLVVIFLGAAQEADAMLKQRIFWNDTDVIPLVLWH